MALYIHDGKIVTQDGNVAVGPGCCDDCSCPGCEGQCCFGAPRDDLTGKCWSGLWTGLGCPGFCFFGEEVPCGSNFKNLKFTFCCGVFGPCTCSGTLEVDRECSQTDCTGYLLCTGPPEDNCTNYSRGCDYVPYN